MRGEHLHGFALSRAFVIFTFAPAFFHFAFVAALFFSPSFSSLPVIFNRLFLLFLRLRVPAFRIWYLVTSFLFGQSSPAPPALWLPPQIWQRWM